MIQSFIIKAAALLAIAVLVVACSSTDSTTATEQPAAVPGEKVSSDNQVMPSATSGVPAASVGW